MVTRCQPWVILQLFAGGKWHQMASVGTSFHPLAFEKLEKLTNLTLNLKKQTPMMLDPNSGPFFGGLVSSIWGHHSVSAVGNVLGWLSSTQGDHLQTGNPCLSPGRWQFNHNLSVNFLFRLFSVFLNFNKNWLLFTILFIPLTKNRNLTDPGALAIIGMRNTAIHD